MKDYDTVGRAVTDILLHMDMTVTGITLGGGVPTLRFPSPRMCRRAAEALEEQGWSIGRARSSLRLHSCPHGDEETEVKA